MDEFNEKESIQIRKIESNFEDQKIMDAYEMDVE